LAYCIHDFVEQIYFPSLKRRNIRLSKMNKLPTNALINLNGSFSHFASRFQTE